MSQKLPVNNFEWVEDISSLKKELIIFKIKKYIKLIKKYDEDSDKGCILEVDVQYSKDLHNLHIDLLFLPERTKSSKCNKLVCSL